MTENLAKLPIKGILRKSSLTFTEHDDSDIKFLLECEKPTKVIVEPVEVPPKEFPGETEEEKAKKEEFEMKRKLYRHQEGMSVQIAKRLLSQEENIEEEAETNPEEEEEEEEEDTISGGSDDAILNTKDDDDELLPTDDITNSAQTKSV